MTAVKSEGSRMKVGRHVENTARDAVLNADPKRHTKAVYSR